MSTSTPIFSLKMVVPESTIPNLRLADNGAGRALSAQCLSCGKTVEDDDEFVVRRWMTDHRTYGCDHANSR